MGSITYKHKKTNQTATYAQPNRRLEKSDDWKRSEPKKSTSKKTDDSSES